MDPSDLTKAGAFCCVALVSPLLKGSCKPLAGISCPISPTAGGLEGSSVFPMLNVSDLHPGFGSNEIIKV